MKENRLICDDCTSLDEKLLKKCEKCGERFCVHNVSEVSLCYCFHCFSDVELRITDVNREVKRVNPLTGKITVASIKTATDYHFDGADWLYAVQKIRDFASDPDGDYKFTKMIEYHKAIANLMLSYREDVRQAKRDKARAEGSIINIPKPASNGSADKVLSSTIHSPEAIARKKVTVLLKQMMGKEPTEEQIQAGMKALGF